MEQHKLPVMNACSSNLRSYTKDMLLNHSGDDLWIDSCVCVCARSKLRISEACGVPASLLLGLKLLGEASATLFQQHPYLGIAQERV